MSKEETVLIAARIPRSLVERVDKLIKKQSPAIKDRTHAIEKWQCEYCSLASRFLSNNNIKMRITLSDTKPAHWEPAGHHYRVTLSHSVIPSGTMNQIEKRSRITFDFWGSSHDMENNIEANEYDVLACISSDVYCPETFEDFCDEYGYEQDSIKALQTFKRADRFAKRLREFFTESEIEQLSQIQ